MTEAVLREWQWKDSVHSTGYFAYLKKKLKYSMFPKKYLIWSLVCSEQQRTCREAKPWRIIFMNHPIGKSYVSYFLKSIKYIIMWIGARKSVALLIL